MAEPVRFRVPLSRAECMARMHNGTERDSVLRSFLPGTVSPMTRLLTDIDTVLPNAFRPGGLFLKEYADGFRLRVGLPSRIWMPLRSAVVLRVRIRELPTTGCELVANGTVAPALRVFATVWVGMGCGVLTLMAGLAAGLMPQRPVGYVPGFLWVAASVVLIAGALVFHALNRIGGSNRDELIELVQYILSLESNRA